MTERQATLGHMSDPLERFRDDVLVYVAGPISQASMSHRAVTDAVRLAARLRACGYVVFVPHNSVLQDMIDPQSHDVWMRLDLNLIAKAADAIFRLPGASKGADMEVALAHELGLPVWTHLSQVPPVERFADHARRVRQQTKESA